MTDFLVKLFIKNSGDTKNPKVRNAYGTLGGVVGIVCNLILCSLKITAGLLSGSISVIADGFNNLSDMGSSVITMIGFKLAGKPADSDHPYGHGRMEYMSALIVSALILLVGFELLKESLTAIFSGAAAPRGTTVTCIILAVSVIFKLMMFLFNRRLGKIVGSNAFAATAQDCINDSISTLAVLVSVIVSAAVPLPFNLDAVVGVGVAAFIIFSGISSAKDTLNSLLGAPPEPELIDDIRECIFTFEGFIGLHDLIVHNYGPGRQFASVHVEVPHNTDIVACHEKIDICEKLVREKLGVELVIHMDPVETDNEQINTARQELSDELKAIHPDLSLHDFRMTPKGKDRTNFIFDVVLPSSVNMSEEEIRKRMDRRAKNINDGYYCVITFDNDYTGK